MYDILFVGNFTRDTIVSPAGTRIVAGGAFNYGAHAARALGLHTAVVTRLGHEDESVIRDLRAIGIDVHPTYTAASTALRLEYPFENPDDRTVAVTANAGAISPREVEGIEARAAVVCPSFAGEIGVDVIRKLAQTTDLLAVDAQGYVRSVVGGRLCYADWQDGRDILRLTTILKVDALEARFLTGRSDIYQAARCIQGEGPREVVLTHRDGVLVFDGKRSYEAPFMPRRTVGRSGRGDTCLAAYAARRLTDDPEEAILWAAALTSQKLEAEGPYAGNPATLRRLVDEDYRPTIGR